MPVFMFTDIEGSTRLWESHGTTMTSIIASHHQTLAQVVTSNSGRVIKEIGDGAFIVFESGMPLRAAVEILKHTAAKDWGIPEPLRIRIALHSGEAQAQGSDYYGPSVNRTQRLMEIAWGGQILVTPEVLEVDQLPPRTAVKDHGPQLLRDMTRPQYVYEIVSFDLPLQHFPPLRSLTAQPQVLPEAMKKAQDIHIDALAIYALIGVARLMESEGKLAESAEVVSLVLVHAPTELIRNKALALMKDLEDKMPPDELSQAAARGRALDLQQYIALMTGTGEEPV